MPREIKFRVWDKINKEFLYWDVKCAVDLPMLNRFSPYKLGTMPNECILSQFTGIKDCDGNDIYEGDIIHSRTFSGDINVVRYEFTHRNTYGHGESFYEYSMGFHFEGYGLSTPTDLKIIGNIYANPEILETK